MSHYSEELLSGKHIVFSCCLAYSKLMSFFCTLVVWHFSCFSNLFTSKLSLFILKFTRSVFSFETAKAKCRKHRHFHIFEKNVLRCRFRKPPLPLPTPKKSWKKFVPTSVLRRKRVLSILGECCFRACLCSQETAKLQSWQARTPLAHCDLQWCFKAWDGQDKRSGRLWQSLQCYCTYRILYVLAHVCVVLQNRDRETVGFCCHPCLKVKPPTQKKQAAFRLHLRLLVTAGVCKY